MAGGILGRLRAILGSAPPASASLVRQIFIEEDEYGEIEVLPAANADWCRDEFARIATFAEAHQAPSGAGWTDMYMRAPAPKPLADLRIPLVATLAALRDRLQPFDRVTSGSFYAPEPITGAHAFGASPFTAAIVIADAGADIVQSILLILREDGAGATEVMSALKGLPSSEPLIVVDWARGGLVQQ